VGKERLGILVGPRGRGTNLRALVRAVALSEIPAEVGVVISPAAESPAAEFARSEGLRLEIIAPGEDFGNRLQAALQDSTLVCLAGFLRLLPEEVLRSRRVLNIHPSLLPKHGGKGMYGMRVHEAVLASGDAESGCTVHRVTPVYDEGEVIVQLRCPVLEGDTPETLAARVLELEQQAYPEAVRRVSLANSL
jgi:phosphoribosylglycinamide formyltransferase-1